MREMRSNGLIPRCSWKPVDMKAALWRTSFVLGTEDFDPEEYKQCKRPHWPSVEAIVGWAGSWDEALSWTNLSRNSGARHYPADAMEAFHSAQSSVPGYLKTEDFQEFLNGSRHPSHGTCYCTLAKTYNRLRYFCGFPSSGNLVRSEGDREELRNEIVISLRTILKDSRSKSHKTYRDRKMKMSGQYVSWFTIVEFFDGGWKEAVQKAGFDITDGETNPEKILRGILEDLGFKFEQEKKLPEWGGDVDFYLPDYDCVLEADGNYWHGHPKTQPYDESQIEDIKRDSEKDTMHRKAGRDVVRVWEESLNEGTSEVRDKIRSILFGDAEVPDGHLSGVEPIV